MNEKITYDSKVRHFGGLRTSFNKGLPKISGFENYWIPKWEDDRIWARHYENNKSIYTDKKGHKAIGSPQELRDICYEFVTKEQISYETCNSTSGWCMTCLMQKDWYKN